MHLVLIRLTAHGPSIKTEPNPEVLTDILWSAAVSGDGLEHVRARHGPRPGTVDVALFHREATASSAELALALCSRAIAVSPVLAGWTAELSLGNALNDSFGAFDAHF